MGSSIRIYQNFFRDDQVSQLDLAFIPRDGRTNPSPEYRETAFFLEFFRQGRYEEATYTGIVSQKFVQKTKIDGKRFIEFIENNPGYDVYFINPFPQNAYHSFNVWEQGEACHPGIMALAQELFDRVGYPITVATMGRNDVRTLLYCNFWVGNGKFWESYMNFVAPLFDCVVNQMSPETRSRFFALTPHIQDTPMLPFIFERLFSTFLLYHPEIAACPYRHSRAEIRQACLHETEWIIVQYFGKMIDEWDQVGVYDHYAREIFSGLLKLTGNYASIKFKYEGPPY